MKEEDDMFSNRRLIALFSLLLPLFAIFIASCAGANLTPRFSHQGRLLDSDGSPVADGNYNMQYRLYHTSSGGTAVFTDTRTVAVEDGLFTTSIGSTTYITPSLFSQPTWMEISINGETLSPRQRLEGAPYAFSLAADSVVRGSVVVTRTFAGLQNTGAAMTVWNTNGGVGGGNGLVVANQAAPSGADRNNVAAFQAIAAGGQTTNPPATGAYGAIIRSENYRGMYAKGGTGYYAAVFDSTAGIWVTGGGSCVGCALAYIAQNDGTSIIEAGDFVAAAGINVDPDLGVPVMMVSKATNATDAIVGVATGAVVRNDVVDNNGARMGGFEPTGGPAESGAYLSVVVQGLVQAKANGGTALQTGDWITLEGGNVALAAPDEPSVARVMSETDSDGLAWVMFNGR
jgi:hypothetical protein